MPLDNRHLHDVPLDIRHRKPRGRGDLQNTILGDQLIGEDTNDVGTLALGGDGEVHRVPVDVHRAAQVGWPLRQIKGQHLSAFGNYLTPTQHQTHLEFLRIIEHDQIGAAARTDTATIVKPEPFGGVQGSHADGSHQIHTRPDRRAHQVIHPTLVQQIARVAIVGAETDAPSIVWRDQRQQSTQIVGISRLADHDIHTQSQFFQRFFDGSTFVIRADARGHISIQFLAR